MNKIKVKAPTGGGWAVHVYDGNRHLRFTLEPSHVWAFGWGIVTGILVAITWSALYSASHVSSNQNQPSTDSLPNLETNLKDDSDNSSTGSSPLEID